MLQGRDAVEGGQSHAQQIVMVLQLCAGLAACKVMSDICTRTLEGAKCLSSKFRALRGDRQPFNAHQCVVMHAVLL